MSGDDHGYQGASRESFTKAIENGDEVDSDDGMPNINVTSDSEKTSTASRTIQEATSPDATVEPEARGNDRFIGRPTEDVVSRNREDTSDSIPDDLPSAHVSHQFISCRGSASDSIRAQQ